MKIAPLDYGTTITEFSFAASAGDWLRKGNHEVNTSLQMKWKLGYKKKTPQCPINCISFFIYIVLCKKFEAGVKKYR